MVQDLTLVTLVIVAANSVTVIVSMALLLLIFWQNPRGRVNQLFSLTVLSLGLYSIFNIISRFSETLKLDPAFITYATSTLYTCFVVSFFYAAMAFASIQTRYLSVLRWFFLLSMIVLVYITWRGWTNDGITPHPEQRGTYQAQLNTIGYLAFLLTLFYPLMTTFILFQARRRAPRLRMLWQSPAAVVAGLLWLATFWSVTFIPLNAVLLAVAAFVFGWAMLSENLFNPLADIREELQEKNTQLLEADQIKNQFLAKMSHELRTPLNSIIGYTDLILDGIYGGLTPQQTDRLEKVIRNGRNLLNLINDILDLSNIEIGQLTLEPTVISTADVLESAIDVVAPQYEAKQLEIIREFDDVPAIFADEQRVRQILYNILSNAVKFTHQGHIRVHTQVINGMVEFAIEDTGIGIPSDKHQFVFEEFRQIDNTATREYGGTGLGMSITKRLVEMSGGRIWLESAPGVGTTFYFTLPRAGTTPIPKVQPPAPVPARERKLKILVVDDEHDIQMYMRDLLLAEKPFWEVTIATSGRDGLRKALRLLPDVITLDIMMPSMDGWEVLKKLQADARLASIPVIIVSHVDHHELAYKFGAKAALVKPINRKELIAHIEKLAYSL